jgi:nicotinamidase-related amidase
LRNPPDVADHVRRRRSERVLTEQARAHFDAREAEALRGEARDFVVGKAGADRQAFEVLRVFLQLLEAAPVACVDGNDGREIVDHVVERVVELRRRDFQRVRRVVLRQYDAVTVRDDAAIGHDRRYRNAVLVGL